MNKVIVRLGKKPAAATNSHEKRETFIYVRLTRICRSFVEKKSLDGEE